MEAALSQKLIAIEPKEWFNHLDVSADAFLAFGIAVVEMLIPGWKERNPKDTVPVRAVDAAKQLLLEPSDGLRSHAKVLSKGCTTSRKKTLGYDHRIAEAARAIANAAAATKSQRRIEAAAEAIQRVEDHLAYMYSIDAVYGKEPEIRRSFLEVIERVTAEQSAGADP